MERRYATLRTGAAFGDTVTPRVHAAQAVTLGSGVARLRLAAQERETRADSRGRV